MWYLLGLITQVVVRLLFQGLPWACDGMPCHGNAITVLHMCMCGRRNSNPNNIHPKVPNGHTKPGPFCSISLWAFLCRCVGFKNIALVFAYFDTIQLVRCGVKNMYVGVGLVQMVPSFASLPVISFLDMRMWDHTFWIANLYVDHLI